MIYLVRRRISVRVLFIFRNAVFKYRRRVTSGISFAKSFYARVTGTVLRKPERAKIIGPPSTN